MASPAAALRSTERSAYTAFIGSLHSAFLLDFHVQRLLHSYQVLFAASPASLPAAVRNGLAGATPGDAGLNLVLLSRDQKISLLHFPRVQWDFSPVKVVLVGSEGVSRAQPTAKDSQWAADRAGLERLKAEERGDELILTSRSSEHGVEGESLLEGLVTNLFVLDEADVLWTAPESRVLPGAVRALVLRAARGLGLTVRLEAPESKNRDTWKAAFLTSATKLVAPVECMVFRGDQARLALDASHPLLAALQSATKALYFDSALVPSTADSED